MKYNQVSEAIFIERPNRFIAIVEQNGQTIRVHVKNTGRCRELLLPGAKVFINKSDNSERKTQFDLIGVYKGDTLINMDSQVPNLVFREWALSGAFGPISSIRSEVRFMDSRLDFFIESPSGGTYIEVKGVTLEENGVARFPDAPTERGIKHLAALESAVNQGFGAYIVFIIQMKGVTKFLPNWKTHPAFGQALTKANRNGVKLLAIDCLVSLDSIMPGNPVPIDLDNSAL